MGRPLSLHLQMFAKSFLALWSYASCRDGQVLKKFCTLAVLQFSEGRSPSSPNASSNHFAKHQAMITSAKYSQDMNHPQLYKHAIILH